MPPLVIVTNHVAQTLTRFQSFLECYKFTVLPFGQDTDTLFALSQLSPDVIIFGYLRGCHASYAGLIRELRSSPPTQAIPIVVCTIGELAQEQDGGQPKGWQIWTGAVGLELEQVFIGLHLMLGLQGGAAESSH